MATPKAKQEPEAAVARDVARVSNGVRRPGTSLVSRKVTT